MPRRVRCLALTLALAASMGLPACTSGGSVGGSPNVLRVAADVEPGVLDWQQSTAAGTQVAGIQIFETLYAVDERYQPVPMLAAAMPSESPDGLAYRIRLRENARFQDGSRMTADDVVASLDRWGKVSTIGQSMYKHVRDVTAVGDSAIHIRLDQRFDVTRTLAAPVAAATVMPKRIIDEYGPSVIDEVEDLVGTGPYRIIEWTKGRRYVLERFEEYAGSKHKPSGLAGAKNATYPRVEVSIVPDASTRLTSTSSGQYDVALAVPAELSSQVEAQDLESQVTHPFYSQFLLLNTSTAPFGDVDVRKAASLALDPEVIGEAAYGDSDLYQLSGALYPDGMGALSTNTGVTQYGERDVDKAKKLLDESGYDGQPLTFMTVQEEPNFYNATVSAAGQLEEAGFNVDIDVTDYAAMSSRYTEPETWDMFSTAFGIGYLVPSAHLLLSGYFPFEGWYAADGPMVKRLRDWQTARNDAERNKAMGALQQQFYRDQPAVKLVDYAGFNAIGPDVEVNGMSFYWPTWWQARRS